MVQWEVPNCMWAASGSAEGRTPLNAFDNALLAAGVGNLNLVRVSSVAPKGVTVVAAMPPLVPGALVPAVVATASSQIPGEVISSCVGIGLGKDSHGMIMEHSSVGSRAMVEAVVRRMLEEAFDRRNLTLDRMILKSATHRVEKAGCTVAAVLLWWR